MVTKQEHKGPAEELKSIFVISPIGKLDDDGFDFTKLFLDQIVKPAAEVAGGYKVPVRADEVRAPGSITGKVVADIIKASVCVADLTGRNPNVMYEVAIAHAADKQVILLQQETGGPPFDFTDQRVIQYTTRADRANRARDELADHLRNANHDAEDDHMSRVMHPVRQIFRELRTSAEAAEPEQAILERLDGLGREMRDIRTHLSYTQRFLQERPSIELPETDPSRMPTRRQLAMALESAVEGGHIQAELLDRLLKDIASADPAEESTNRRGEAEMRVRRATLAAAEANLRSERRDRPRESDRI